MYHMPHSLHQTTLPFDTRSCLTHQPLWGLTWWHWFYSQIWGLTGLGEAQDVSLGCSQMEAGSGVTAKASSIPCVAPCLERFGSLRPFSPLLPSLPLPSKLTFHRTASGWTEGHSQGECTRNGHVLFCNLASEITWDHFGCILINPRSHKCHWGSRDSIFWWRHVTVCRQVFKLGEANVLSKSFAFLPNTTYEACLEKIQPWMPFLCYMAGWVDAFQTAPIHPLCLNNAPLCKVSPVAASGSGRGPVSHHLNQIQVWTKLFECALWSS